jgi:hypothetical protein
MGFEPTTTGITIRDSNQLSYAHRRAGIIPAHAVRFHCYRCELLNLNNRWCRLQYSIRFVVGVWRARQDSNL